MSSKERAQGVHALCPLIHDQQAAARPHTYWHSLANSGLFPPHYAHNLFLQQDLEMQDLLVLIFQSMSDLSASQWKGVWQAAKPFLLLSPTNPCAKLLCLLYQAGHKTSAHCTRLLLQTP